MEVGTKTKMIVNLVRFANIVWHPNGEIGLLVLRVGNTTSVTLFITEACTAKIGML